MADISAWRKNRKRGWYKDIGYIFQLVIQVHHYKSEVVHPSGDPGLHNCTCGWEGYWSQFEPHVADHLRAALVTAVKNAEEDTE